MRDPKPWILSMNQPFVSSSIGWRGFEDEDDDEHEDEPVHGPNACAKAEEGFP
jgi:hypothetical protein